MKPFRFGDNLGLSGSRAEWVEKARRLEALGARAFCLGRLWATICLICLIIMLPLA